MGKKAKKPAKSSAVAGDENDVTISDLISIFKKESHQQDERDHVMAVMQILESFEEEADTRGVFRQLCVGQVIGPSVTRTFIRSVLVAKYAHLQSICFWRADIQDDGARAVAEYLKQSPVVTKCEIRDCHVGAQGCEALAEGILMNNRAFKSLQTLRLEFNPFASEGIAKLAAGFERNRSIVRLSLKYCQISSDRRSCQALHRILSNAYFLQELDLEGNQIRSVGCVAVFSGLKSSTFRALRTINLVNNDIGTCISPYEDENVDPTEDESEMELGYLDEFAELFSNCTSVQTMYLHGNFFDTLVADIFLAAVEKRELIKKVTLPHTLPEQIIEHFNQVVKAKSVTKSKPSLKKSKSKAKKKSKKK